MRKISPVFYMWSMIGSPLFVIAFLIVLKIFNVSISDDAFGLALAMLATVIPMNILTVLSFLDSTPAEVEQIKESEPLPFED